MVVFVPPKGSEDCVLFFDSLISYFLDLLKKEVYLFERLDGGARSTMSQVIAIVFVRPTQENFSLLIKELRSPAYK